MSHNPINPRQEFNPDDTLRLEVESAPLGLPNLVQNPSGAKGAWGWVTPVANTLVTSSGTDLTFKTTVSQAAYFTSEFMPVTVGKYISSRLDFVSVTASHNLRIRYEWYSNTKTLLSSSIQSGNLSTIGTNYGPVVVVPAGAAFVKFRADFYNTASNPSANAQVVFKKAMVSWTNTGTVSSVRTNLVPNPTFEVDVTGWASVGPAYIARSNLAAQFGTYSCRVVKAAGTATMGVTTTGLVMPVTPNRTYTSSAYVRPNGTAVMAEIFLIFLASTGKTLATTSTQTMESSGAWTRIKNTATAPPSASYATVRVNFRDSSTNGSHYVDGVMLTEGLDLVTYFDGSTTATADMSFAWSGTAHSSASTSVTTAGKFNYTESHEWINILGPSHEISIEREALDVGTLTATVVDSKLDPAVATDIAPGKKVRVRMTRDSGTTWDSLYEGRITNANVSYDRDSDRPGYAGRAAIPGTPMTPSTRTNLVPNPSFETNLSGWGLAAGDNLTRVTGGSVGTYCARAVPSMTYVDRWNLIENPSFEVDTSGWGWSIYGSGADTTLERVSGGAVGGYCARNRVTSGTSVEGLGILQFTQEVNELNTYTLSFYAKSTKAGIPVRVTGDAGSWSLNKTVGTSTNEWTRYSTTIAIPEGVWQFNFNVSVYEAGASFVVGDSFSLDGVVLEGTVGTLKPYFDGSTPDTDEAEYSWLGTAHNSVSVRKVASPVDLEIADPVPVTGGQNYSISFAHKGGAGRIVKLWWYIADADGNYLDGDFLPVGTSTTSWQRLGTTVTAPAGATDLIFSLYVDDPAPNEEHFFDAVLVEESVSIRPYFDGSFSDTSSATYSWSGTAHASLSLEMQRVVRRNLVPNPSFETNLTSWNWNGVFGAHSAPNTIARTNAQSHSGGYSVRLDWADSNSLASNYLTQITGLTVGAKYTLSAWIWASDNTQPVVLDALFVTTSAPMTLKNQWVRMSLTFTPTSSSTFVGVRPNAATPSGDAGFIFLDDVMLELGTTMSDYFDGSMGVSRTQTCTWTGTAHASISEATTTTGGRPALPASDAVNTTSISLTAVDNVTALANQKDYRGVSLEQLPAILEDKGVPWLVNGSGNQVSSYLQIASNDSASALDQISIARDSAQGYAWVNRENVLVAATPANMNNTVKATYSDVTGVSYSNIDAGFNTDACINEVTVNWLRYNGATGETEEISYGPYRSDASIATYGAHSATFTIQGATESSSSIETFANSVLAANAVPVRRASSLSVPIVNSASLTAALADLYDLVAVEFGSGIVNAQYRVTGIKHRIRPDGWLMDLEFAVNGSVASPTQTPSPTSTSILSGQWINVGSAGAPAWQNTWKNYGGAYGITRFRRDGNVVTLEGLMIPPAVNANNIAFQLPVGFRPGSTQLFNGLANATTGAASTGTAHTHTAQAATRVQIDANGNVTPGAGAAYAANYFSLAGISFIAEG